MTTIKSLHDTRLGDRSLAVVGPWVCM